MTQIKTLETDGYNAVQVAFGEGKNLSKATAGHTKPANVSPKHLKEIRVDELPEGIKVGDKLDVEAFAMDELVTVTGTSKGKGFAGTIILPAKLKPTVVKATPAKLVRLVQCTHKKSSKVSVCQVAWVTTKFQ